MSRSRSESRLSLAIGPDAVVGVSGSGGSVAVAPLSLPAQGNASPALAQAFATIAGQIGDAGAGADQAVDVVLLPPLVDVRLIELPPLDAGEAEAVLQRNASRYFLGGGQARVIGIAQPARAEGGSRRRLATRRTGQASTGVTSNGVEADRTGTGGPRATRPPILAAASPATLVEAVHLAVRETGWRLNRVVPAHAAWLAAARTSDGQGSRKGAAVTGATPDVVVAEHDGSVHVIRLARGTPVALRRVPAADPDEVVRAAGDSAGRAFVIAGGDALAGLSGALQTAGWSVTARNGAGSSGSTGATESAHPSASPAAIEAARHTHGAEPELVPLSIKLAHRDRNRRLAGRLAVAAVALFAVAAVFELWSVHRAVGRVREARAEIRAEVAPLIAMQDSISRMNGRMAALEAIDAASPDWTRALTDIAVLLPFDSHLTSFVASGDTLEIEAAGTRAGEALQALRGAASLTDVRLIGMVDRELDDGTTAVERFRIWARLAPDGPAHGAGKANADEGGEL